MPLLVSKEGAASSAKLMFNIFNPITLESGIDVGQGINVGPGKFIKKNKRRALDKRRACTKGAKLCSKKTTSNLKISVGHGKNSKI